MTARGIVKPSPVIEFGVLGPLCTDFIGTAIIGRHEVGILPHPARQKPRAGWLPSTPSAESLASSRYALGA